MLGDETGDADAVTLAGDKQVTGEAGIEPVQGDKSCDAVMEPKSGDAIHKADMPVPMGVLWYRKRGRLKTGATAKYDSTGVWRNEASACFSLQYFGCLSFSFQSEDRWWLGGRFHSGMYCPGVGSGWTVGYSDANYQGGGTGYGWQHPPLQQ